MIRGEPGERRRGGALPSRTSEGSSPRPDPALAHLDEYIARFEAALWRGEPAEIEDYLPSGEPDRIVLIVELVLVELEYRASLGESIDLARYQGRFRELDEDDQAWDQLEVGADELLQMLSDRTTLAGVGKGVAQAPSSPAPPERIGLRDPGGDWPRGARRRVPGA